MTTSTGPIRPHSLRLRILTVLIAVILPLASACSSSQATTMNVELGTQVSESLMQTLHKITRNSLDQSILPDQVSLLRIAGPPVHTGKKPTVLYMGADFCPYCAAIRWPLVLALMRFGHFSNLSYMRSAHDDVYADTVTFSFHGAQYESKYITFEAVELQDREGNRLGTPTRRQIEIFREFDTKPYTRYPGAIPFLYLNGEYMQSGAPFSPGILKGMSWKDVANKLQKTKSPVAQTILGVTNLYTAAICKLTDGQPARVCDSDAVESAAARLPDQTVKPK